MLWDSNKAITATGNTFDSASYLLADGDVNVEATQGTITFTGFGGNYAGEAIDFDNGGVADWIPFGVTITETAASTDVNETGATEAHGKHLPLDVDTHQVATVAERLAARVDALVAPALPYGYATTWMGYPGTMTLSSETYQQVLVELASSLVEKYFAGTTSSVGGIGVFEVAEEAIRVHRAAFDSDVEPRLVAALLASATVSSRLSVVPETW